MLHVTGVVQGVGFRPFVYNLARSMGLAGWVLNSSEGVFIHVEGEPAAVEGFFIRLEREAPPMAVIESVVRPRRRAGGLRAASRSGSRNGRRGRRDAHLARHRDVPAVRWPSSTTRMTAAFGYPFINCTNCGPRFTIIDDIPYDRPEHDDAVVPDVPRSARPSTATRRTGASTPSRTPASSAARACT